MYSTSHQQTKTLDLYTFIICHPPYKYIISRIIIRQCVTILYTLFSDIYIIYNNGIDDGWWIDEWTLIMLLIWVSVQRCSFLTLWLYAHRHTHFIIMHASNSNHKYTDISRRNRSIHFTVNGRKLKAMQFFFRLKAFSIWRC